MRMAMRRSFGSTWFICKAASRNARRNARLRRRSRTRSGTNSPVCLKIFPPNSGISGSMISVTKLLQPGEVLLLLAGETAGCSRLPGLPQVAA